MLNVTLQLCFSWLRYVIDWKKNHFSLPTDQNKTNPNRNLPVQHFPYPRSQGLLLTRGNEVEDVQRLAPITIIWFEIVENCQPTPPPTKDFALRKKYVFTLD